MSATSTRVTTKLFLYALRATHTLNFERWNGRGPSDGMTGDDMLDLICDIEEYNKDLSVPNTMHYVLETLVERSADAVRRRIRLDIYASAATVSPPDDVLHRVVTEEQMHPPLTDEQLLRLLRLFREYVADDAVMNVFYNTLRDPVSVERLAAKERESLRPPVLEPSARV